MNICAAFTASSWTLFLLSYPVSYSMYLTIVHLHLFHSMADRHAMTDLLWGHFANLLSIKRLRAPAKNPTSPPSRFYEARPRRAEYETARGYPSLKIPMRVSFVRLCNIA